MSDVQDKVNRLEAEVAELRSMDKVKRLEAEVAELRLMVLERDKIILELKGDKLSGKERRNCDAGTTWAVVCADVYLSHWCEMRLMPYVELVRMSMLCRTMQKRVVDSLRLLRRLDFRFVRIRVCAFLLSCPRCASDIPLAGSFSRCCAG